jgi:hypothetical protein
VKVAEVGSIRDCGFGAESSPNANGSASTEMDAS